MKPSPRQRVASLLSVVAMMALAVGVWLDTSQATSPPSEETPPPPLKRAAPSVHLADVSLPPPIAPKIANAAEPEPHSAPAIPMESTVAERTITPTAQSVQTGRILLRQLEAGDGPNIEIAWPDAPNDREALYDAFVRHLGMVTVLLSDDGHLYRDGGTAKENWRPNTDTYSTFARQAAGQLPSHERHLINRIRHRHGINGTPVRLFPRAVDAVVLGGLDQLMHRDEAPAPDVRAQYRLHASRIEITNITLGGQRIAGTIAIALNP